VQREWHHRVLHAHALQHRCRSKGASEEADRAIAYREVHGFDHMRVALSVGIQQMVADLAGSGLMFCIDTETGFDKAVLINAAWVLARM